MNENDPRGTDGTVPRADYPAAVATLLRDAKARLDDAASDYADDSAGNSNGSAYRACADVSDRIETFLASDGCIAKARDGEPAFTLLARDPDAALLVREWGARRAAACRLAGQDDAHARSATAVAEAMEAYRADPTNWSRSAPPVEAYPPSPAATYRFARSLGDQLLLSNLTVRVLRALALSGLALPGAEQAKAWLREYIDGTRPGHGPLGSPMMWPVGCAGIEALLRGWGFQPTPSDPAYVSQTPEAQS